MVNRWLSTLLSLLVLHSSWAQSEQRGQIDRYVLHELPYVEIDTTSTLWDLSSLEMQRSYTVQEKGIQESPFKATFPQATQFMDMGGGDHIYLKMSDQGIERYGGIANGSVISYDDPQLVLPLPITSGMDSKDVFSGGFEWQGVVFDRIGNIRVRAYESGIIRLPDDLCLEAILVRSEEKIIDAYEVSGSTRKIVTKNTVYQFFIADDFRPILSMTEKEVDGVRSSAFGTLLSMNDLSISHPDLSGLKDIGISAIATEQGVEVSIPSSEIGLTTYSVLNASGEVLRSEPLTIVPKERKSFLLPWSDYRPDHQWIAFHSGERIQLIPFPSF